MIDVKLIRENPNYIKEIVKRRGNIEKADIDKWLKIDKKRRELIFQQDSLNEERNRLASRKDLDNSEIHRQEAKELKINLKVIDEEIRNLTNEWQQILDWIPNIPFNQDENNMPYGESDADNIILKAWTPNTGYILDLEGKKARGTSEGYMDSFPLHADNTNFSPMLHLELGNMLGYIDSEQAGKVSGSRFTYLVGDLVLLQYAIQRFVLDELLRRGFTLIVPPILVKERALYGSSHFPEGRDQIYAIKNDNVEDGNNLYLLGSTEPANFAYYMDKVLEENDLPKKLVAYAPAFRSEAGSWGKDTRGIKRLHQFDKIEMDVICKPDQSNEVFEELLRINEWLLQSLELPYQLALKCTADAGYHASAKQVDPEVWLPVQKEFMEVGTDTNATDYQARRLNIKFRDKNGKKELVHTVNDTGVAMGRILICILEHYQQSDGSIKIPKVLQPLLNKEFIGKPI